MFSKNEKLPILEAKQLRTKQHITILVIRFMAEIMNVSIDLLCVKSRTNIPAPECFKNEGFHVIWKSHKLVSVEILKSHSTVTSHYLNLGQPFWLFFYM
jgi:hypothetical protein